MKSFHYPLGHAKGSTLTAIELRKLLEFVPDDTPVLAEWEGVGSLLTTQVRLKKSATVSSLTLTIIRANNADLR
jgi:hypothetical protein